MHRIALSFLLLAATASAFAPPFLAVGSTKKLSLSPLVPNFFEMLPWNEAKALKQADLKNRVERSRLHRELGISTDASYDEIVAQTQHKIDLAGNNIKQKIKIEVIRDTILENRLRERISGNIDFIEGDALAYSMWEEGGKEEEAKMLEKQERKEKAAKGWQAPAWTKGLVVKPDKPWLDGQIKIWGGASLLGLLFPPLIDYANRFSWLICAGQLTRRGMPVDQQGGGGFAMRFGMGPGSKKHIKVAWFLTMAVTISGGILVYGLMPKWAQGRRWTPIVAFGMRNLIYGVATSYLQPYKGP